MRYYCLYLYIINNRMVDTNNLKTKNKYEKRDINISLGLWRTCGFCPNYRKDKH